VRVVVPIVVVTGAIVGLRHAAKQTRAERDGKVFRIARHSVREVLRRAGATFMRLERTLMRGGCPLYASSLAAPRR